MLPRSGGRPVRDDTQAVGGEEEVGIAQVGGGNGVPWKSPAAPWKATIAYICAARFTVIELLAAGSSHWLSTSGGGKTPLVTCASGKR